MLRWQAVVVNERIGILACRIPGNFFYFYFLGYDVGAIFEFLGVGVAE